jgi:O-succinylbenzoate synthase
MTLPTKIFQDLTVLSIPLRNRFRGIDIREVAIFRGDQGWSEFSPFIEYGEVEASTWLKAALEAAYKPWPKQYRDRIPINATLPMVEPDQAPQILSRFPGCTTVKIKVDDFVVGAELIEATLDEIPDAKIRLDVNEGWTLEEALLNLYDYNLRFGNIFEYIEQPCKSLDDLKRLKRETPFKIAADESIRKNLDAHFEEFSQYADVAILKWAPVGGFDAAHELASRIGLPVVISSALETGVGISQSLALAGSFPQLDYACGLGTVSLFESDICEPAFTVSNGFMEVRRGEPVPALLSKYQAAPERVEWWHNRISAIWNSKDFREGSEWQ